MVDDGKIAWDVNPKKRSLFFDTVHPEIPKDLFFVQWETPLCKHLQRLFKNKSISSIVSKFLKPSDLRALIVILQLKNYAVSVYFEHLCRYFLSLEELNKLVDEYVGPVSLSRLNDIKQHWSVPVNSRGLNLQGENEEHVELLCTTFVSGGDKDVSETVPYQLMYCVEVFGRYCDECKEMLSQRQEVKPRLIQIKKRRKKRHKNDSSTKGEGKKREKYTLVVDESLAQAILCEKCSNRFVSRDIIQPLLYQIASDGFLFHGVSQFLPKDFSKLTLDHGGALLDINSWNTFYFHFTRTRDEFKTEFRKNFFQRMTRKFGQCFFHQFIYKILPTNRFLEIDAKQRTYNPIPWVSRALALGKRKSRFEHGPFIDRYPLGSLERSTAYQISEDFDIWSTSDSLQVAAAAESRIVEKFALALDIFHHPDYKKAVSFVEDFILTRQIDREKFDHLFLSSLWRVLHRGQTREKRRFTGCMYDRQRVDKFFCACCTTAKAPVLPVKGYLGFEEESIDDLEKSSSLYQEPSNGKRGFFTWMLSLTPTTETPPQEHAKPRLPEDFG